MTPEAIQTAEFPPALRGYDKQQVRVYLEKLGGEYRTLQSKLAEAETTIIQLRASQQPQNKETTAEIPAYEEGVEAFDADQFDKFGLQVAGLLREARDWSAQTKSQAELEAQAQLEQSRTESERLLSTAQTEADRLLADAHEQKKRAETDAKAAVSSAESEAELIRSTVEAEIVERQQKCDAEIMQLHDAANKVLTDKQNEADELWNSAEAEAYKVGEASREEASEIKRVADAERSETLEKAEKEAEALRKSCDAEIAQLRKQAAEDTDRLKVESDIKRQEMLHEAERTLAENQTQATEILAHANSEAEKLMADAFSEADRIRLDAESSVMQLRSDTDLELAAKHEEADAYVSTMTKEGDDYVAARRAEADEFYERRYSEAEEYVAARQGEVFKDAEEAQQARDKAYLEITEAQKQVGDLLEQARAQSEFIRQEAEEVIRAKVRANIDQAERRIARLRITEQASRDRIATAQRELHNAIGSLNSEPVVELGDGTDEAVLIEAKDRLLESGDDFDTDAGIAAISEAGYGSGNAMHVEADADNNYSGHNDSDDTGEHASIDLAQMERSSPENAADDDGDENKTSEHSSVRSAEPSIPPPFSNQTATNGGNPDGKLSVQADSPTGPIDSVKVPPPPPGSTPSLPPADLRSNRGRGLDSVGNTTIEKTTAETGPLPEVDNVLKEPPIEPQDEDALSRLVQEAMKRAVESAKRGPGTQN